MAFERAWKGNQVPSAKHIIQYKTKRNWSENILFLKSGVNQHFTTKPTLRGSCLSLEIFREDKNGVGSILLYFFPSPFPPPWLCSSPPCPLLYWTCSHTMLSVGRSTTFEFFWSNVNILCNCLRSHHYKAFRL